VVEESLANVFQTLGPLLVGNFPSVHAVVGTFELNLPFRGALVMTLLKGRTMKERKRTLKVPEAKMNELVMPTLTSTLCFKLCERPQVHIVRDALVDVLAVVGHCALFGCKCKCRNGSVVQLNMRCVLEN
jgi:hypothetical protein